jgi:hypothetical protein
MRSKRLCAIPVREWYYWSSFDSPILSTRGEQQPTIIRTKEPACQDELAINHHQSVGVLIPVGEIGIKR